jgi:hypothetical protein
VVLGIVIAQGESGLGSVALLKIRSQIAQSAFDSNFAMAVSVEDQNHLGIPVQFELNQNYPNPFNPATTIKYQIPKMSIVTLKVYDVLGREVASLVYDRLSAGSYSYEWDASHLTSGAYLYQLNAGEYVETKKMMLLR